MADNNPLARFSRILPAPAEDELMYNPYARMQQMLGPYGISVPEPSQNLFLPQTGFFGRHPGITQAIERGVLGAAFTEPSDTIGEGISNVARTVLNLPQLRQQVQLQRLAGPMAFATQLDQLGMSDLRRQYMRSQIENQYSQAEARADQRSAWRARAKRDEAMALRPDASARMIQGTRFSPPLKYDQTTGKWQFAVPLEDWRKQTSTFLSQGGSFLEREMARREQEIGRPMSTDERAEFANKYAYGRAEAAGAGGLEGRGAFTSEQEQLLSDARKTIDRELDTIKVHEKSVADQSGFFTTPFYKFDPRGAEYAQGTPTAQRRQLAAKSLAERRAAVQAQYAAYTAAVMRDSYTGTYQEFLKEESTASPIPRTSMKHKTPLAAGPMPGSGDAALTDEEDFTISNEDNPLDLDED